MAKLQAYVDDTAVRLKSWRSWSFLPYWRTFVLILTPIILLPLPLAGNTQEAECAYIVCIMAIYWMTESLPLPVTGMIPLVGFPLFGIMSAAELCPIYMKETMMMFVGGLTMAAAVEHCNLHKRIAIYVILHMGQSPRRLMAGFMFTTMFLSMWNYNTATTAMMLPIVEAILVELYSKEKDEKQPLKEETEYLIKTPQPVKTETNIKMMEDHSGPNELNSSTPIAKIPEEISSADKVDDLNLTDIGKEMRKALLISVAYSANIGGTGVVTGTGPNIILMAILDESFSESTGLSFASWMAFNIPTAMICVAITFLWLQFYFLRGKGVIEKNTKEDDLRVKKILTSKYEALGSISFHEVTVLVLYVILVTLWFFKSPKFIPGWGSWFVNEQGKSYMGNTTAVVMILVLLFAIPKKLNFWCFRDLNDPTPERSTEGCITWDVIQNKIPWGIIFLVGGGFAIGEASGRSGLSRWFGEQLNGLATLPSGLIVLVVSIMTAMVTEVVSNMGTASILLPVLRQMALGLRVNPIYLMLPSAIACSYAFMLPVATATNALVFSAGRMKTIEMIKPGFVMNVVCVLVMNVMINTLGVAMFDLRSFPAWTNSTVF